jgi:hypothetical protein
MTSPQRTLSDREGGDDSGVLEGLLILAKYGRGGLEGVVMAFSP